MRKATVSSSRKPGHEGQRTNGIADRLFRGEVGNLARIDPELRHVGRSYVNVIGSRLRAGHYSANEGFPPPRRISGLPRRAVGDSAHDGVRLDEGCRRGVGERDGFTLLPELS